MTVRPSGRCAVGETDRLNKAAEARTGRPVLHNPTMRRCLRWDGPRRGARVSWLERCRTARVRYAFGLDVGLGVCCGYGGTELRRVPGRGACDRGGTHGPRGVVGTRWALIPGLLYSRPSRPHGPSSAASFLIPHPSQILLIKPTPSFPTSLHPAITCICTASSHRTTTTTTPSTMASSPLQAFDPLAKHYFT